MFTNIIINDLCVFIGVPQTVLKYKTYAYIIEVTRLDIFHKLSLPLTTTLYLLHGRWWEMVFPPSGALHNDQKECIPRAIRGLMTELTYPQWYTILPLVHLLQLSSKDLPDSITIYKVLTSITMSANQIVVPLLPMIGVTCMCIFVVLLVNKCHYWLSGRKTTTYIVKPYFIVQEKLLCHENYCFFY